MKILKYLKIFIYFIWFLAELDYFKKISVVIITSHNKISKITHVQVERGVSYLESQMLSKNI